MSKQTLIIVAAAIALWILLRKNQSVAASSAAPTFGADNTTAPAAATATQPLTLPPTRSLDQLQADFKVQAANPAYQASIDNPSVAASNAYYGQFIGKIS